MSDAQYSNPMMPSCAPEKGQPKLIRLATIKSNKFPLVSTDFTTKWDIDVPHYFQSMERVDLIQPAQKSVSIKAADDNAASDDYTILSWIVTSFLLTIVSSVVGFGDLAGSFSTAVKFVALAFGLLFIGTSIYATMGNGQRSSGFDN